MTQITCPYCNSTFTEEESLASCARCSLFGSGGCRKLRCPRCGYEMPAPARLPRLVGKLIETLREKK